MGGEAPHMKKSVVRQLSYKNFLAKFLYDNIFQKFLSQDMAFTGVCKKKAKNKNQIKM